MKNKYTLSFFSILLMLFTCNVSIAQPEISNVNFPDIGDSIVLRVLDPDAFIIDDGGSDVTWDYTNAEDQDASFTQKFTSPTETPFAPSFPDADITLEFDAGFTTFYQYYNIETDRLELFGLAYETPYGPYSLVYTDPEVVLITPSTFLTSSSDTFAADRIDDGIFTETEGSLIYDVDAYGTLLLPNNITYENVIRIKVERTSENNSEVNGITQTSYVSELDYEFWSADYQFSVANYSQSTTTSDNAVATLSSFFYTSDLPVITSTQNITEDYNLNLYINNGLINWSAEEAIKNLSVWTVDGKLIQQEKVNSANGSASFKGKSSAGYIVKLQYSDGQSASKMIIAKP